MLGIAIQIIDFILHTDQESSATMDFSIYSLFSISTHCSYLDDIIASQLISLLESVVEKPVCCEFLYVC